MLTQTSRKFEWKPLLSLRNRYYTLETRSTIGQSMQTRLYLFTLLSVLIWSCDPPSEAGPERAEPSSQTFFQLLDSTATGVAFNNRVADSNDFNVLTYRNYYNGGGVAIGDINNDGLSDLYFTANLTANRLYLNRGDFVFEDITETAGVAGDKAWSTGVTMADVNGDGWLDIYVSNSGDISGDNKENELYINNGDLSFTEKAADYGLNNGGYSTQAAFFDYDLDGDLDCYLLNNSFKDPSRIELYRSMRDQPDALAGDKLYRNDGQTFTDVTQAAGIYSSRIGFGLGTCIGDVNHDFLPDIYVSNDFWERDYLYINQGDGTFSEELIDRINYCSISSMGGDIADINNDGHPEIISTDMLAADNYRLKAMTQFDPYHLEDTKYRANYHYQIGQNCLQLNNGAGYFQEIAMLSGVAATDWSWGALIFDFENDGNKDLFVSNGIQRDLMYMDFRDFLADSDLSRKIKQRSPDVDLQGAVTKMPANPLRNFAFANTGKDLNFVNQTEQLGFDQASFSNGAAYGDLDNDGDLDLVINNVNTPAFLYRNEAEQTANHYLKVKLKGYGQNLFGIGALLKITTDQGIQTLQNFNTRGFQSSIEPHVIFGLGASRQIKELEVIWPDQKKQVLTKLEVDQELIIDYQDATATAQPPSTLGEEKTFAELSDQLLPADATHRENRYNDFDHEILLWRMLSTEGPRIVSGDVNNDQREDFILLGAHGDPDKLFVQTADGAFQRKPSPDLDATEVFESTCGTFLDYDQDGDLDLLIGSGGNEYQRGNKYFILRYYENDGRGNFRVDNSHIPQVLGNFSCIEAEDYDQDGDTDLFLGSRCVPGHYGLPARSYLLQNEGGQWIDRSPESLAGAGLVTDATWQDIDNDQDKDLIVVGEWMDIQIFRNDGSNFTKTAPIAHSNGWWTRVEGADLDGDGDTDFVLGNWGLNTKFKASPTRPLTMFVNDFDQNGKSEFLINWYAPMDRQAYPFATKTDLIQQLPGLRKKILKYEDYSKQTYETLFPPELRQQSYSYEVNNLQSAVLWNEGDGFSLHPLPVEAQFSPVFGIAVQDWNEDGIADIWLGGNFYALKPQVGRQDASRGLLLEGTGGTAFRVVGPEASGISVAGEVRDACVLNVGNSKALLVSRNNADALIFKRNAGAKF